MQSLLKMKILMLLVAMLALALSDEMTKNMKQVAVEFYETYKDQITEDYYSPCVRACGEAWLNSVIKQEKVAVVGCDCEHFTIQGLENKRYDVEDFLKEFGGGIKLEDVKNNPKATDTLDTALRAGSIAIQAEELRDYVFEAARSAHAAYRQNDCKVCIHTENRTLKWQGGKEVRVCFLAIKGSSIPREWTDHNFRFGTASIQLPYSQNKKVAFHRGFMDYYSNLEYDPRLMEFLRNPECQVRVVVGHSLGAAIAHILSAILSKFIDAVYLFGLPNVMVSQAGEFTLPPTFSIIHAGDLIQVTPPSLTHIPSSNFTESKGSFEYEGTLETTVVEYLINIIAIVGSIIVFRKYAIVFLILLMIITLMVTLAPYSTAMQTLVPELSYSTLFSLPGNILRERRAMTENHLMDEYLYTAMQQQLCGRYVEREQYMKYYPEFLELMKNPTIRKRDKDHHLGKLFELGEKCT